MCKHLFAGGNTQHSRSTLFNLTIYYIWLVSSLLYFKLILQPVFYTSPESIAMFLLIDWIKSWFPFCTKPVKSLFDQYFSMYLYDHFTGWSKYQEEVCTYNPKKLRQRDSKGCHENKIMFIMSNMYKFFEYYQDTK